MDWEGREEWDATDGVGVDLSFDEPGLDNGGARRCCLIRREVEPISKLMKSLEKTYTAREARWTSTDWRSSFERTREKLVQNNEAVEFLRLALPFFCFFAGDTFGVPGLHQSQFP